MRRGQGKKLSSEADSPEITENLSGIGMVESEKAGGSGKVEEAANAALMHRAGTVASDENLRRLREVWPHLGVGEVSTDLYDKFQKFRELLEGTLWKQFGHSPMGISDHDFFIEILRAVERERAEQKEAARKNLEKAQMATRCAHVHLDGARCGCPKMKDSELCYIHDKLEKAKSAKLDLGPMDDPDSIQVGIAKLQTAVIDGMLEPMQVRQLAYLIQLAAWNVRQTTLMSQRWDVGAGLGGRSK
jgi:hypothetical protein